MVANFTERNFKKRPAGNRILSKEANLETIAEALKRSDWPFIPFNKVAGIGELLITPITHKQSPLVVKRAMAALESASTPADFAAKVRDIKKEDFDNLLVKLPEEMRQNPRAFYKLVKAVGSIGKSGVLVDGIISNQGKPEESIITLEKGLEEMIQDTYCKEYKPDSSTQVNSPPSVKNR